MADTSVENVLHLSKPVLYNGEEITELAFDFDKLTGADALNIEEELGMLRNPCISALLTMETTLSA